MPNDSPLEAAPPYVSVGIFEKFLQLLEIKTFSQITATELVVGGISESSTWGLLSALRTMKIIDDEGMVLDVQELNKLGTTTGKQSVLRDIVERTYPNLLAADFLPDAELTRIKD